MPDWEPVKVVSEVAESEPVAKFVVEPAVVLKVVPAEKERADFGTSQVALDHQILAVLDSEIREVVNQEMDFLNLVRAVVEMAVSCWSAKVIPEGFARVNG